MEDIESVVSPAVKRPIQDVYITLLFYMFSTNIFLSLCGILLASIPYYNYFGIEQTKEGMLFSGICAILFYIAFFLSLSSKLHTRIIIATGLLWWTSLSLFIGFMSAILYNISLIQWVLISWAQSVAMIVYIRSWKIEWYLTLVILIGTSLGIWLISLYGFLIENDWLMSGVIACMACALVAYNMWQVKNLKDRGDLSWEQTVWVCAQYYCPL